MDQFKLSNFQKFHEGACFPQYQTLSDAEAHEIRRKLSMQLGLISDDGLLIVNSIRERMNVLSHCEVTTEPGHLRQLLESSGVHPEVHVYVNWYRFDTIDRFALNDLDMYFSDIWYPSSDDIDVFDSTLSWMLTIYHYEAASLCML